MSSSTILKTDVAIIGAGPVGLFSIFECGMLGLKCHVIDALDAIGGQCTALYPEKPIYDIPGYPQILAGDLVHRLQEQAAPFSPVFHLGHRVTKLESLSDDHRSWRLTTLGTASADSGLSSTEASSRVIEARCVIIAAGVGAFGPNRPPLEGIEAFEGQSVHYYVKSREAFRDKRVVIAGGGDSAVDWALSLSEVARHVSVVHRRDKFRAAPESESRLKQLGREGRIDLVIPYQLAGVQGHDGILTHVEVSSLEGKSKVLEADALLPFFGLSMDLGPIATWGLGLERHHIKIDPETAATSHAGIYAVGDIATYPHKLKLILTGFAEGAQAAHHIRKFLYPDEQRHFEYSTTQGVPGVVS